MGENGSSHLPVTYESCEHIGGPFYHGRKSALEVGDELVAGWEGHDPEVLKGMLDRLALLREQGLDVIED